MVQHDLWLACKCLLADLEGAVEMIGDECPACWRRSIAEAKEALGREEDD